MMAVRDTDELDGMQVKAERAELLIQNDAEALTAWRRETAGPVGTNQHINGYDNAMTQTRQGNSKMLFKAVNPSSKPRHRLDGRPRDERSPSRYDVQCYANPACRMSRQLSHGRSASFPASKSLWFHILGKTRS